MKYNNSDTTILGERVLTPATSSLDCDVVIVNYNAGSLLQDCVASVNSEGDLGVIVVDNASTDGSLDALERSFYNKKSITIIRNQRNVGFASACNLGAINSRSQRILFLNPDCVVAPGSIEKMIRTLENSSRVGMVGGFLSNLDGSEQPGGRRVFPTPKRAFMRAFGFSRATKFFPEVFMDFLLHKEPLPNAPVAVEAISGACMLVKREAIEDVGLWDSKYFLHCEDLDWCMRFRQKGWVVMFVPDAVVVHVWGACSRNRPFFVEWHKHHGMLRFYGKFFRKQYPGILWILVVFGVWFRFALVATYYTLRLPLSKLGLLRA